VSNQNLNVKDITNKKKSDTDWPERWKTLDHGIRVGRYIDKEFLDLEFEKLWSKTWQVAARVDAIPEVNDFITYDIGDQSVFVVRVDQDTIKAYHNVCPHRGTALAMGQGSFAHGNIICPFHGWRWDTQGENHYVLERHEFRDGKLCNSDVALKSLPCVEYAGFVFINFDKDCTPFEDYIAPVKQLLDDCIIKDMRHYWWKKIPVPANWKAAQEAFFEGYHVPATHPQLETAAAEFIYGEKIEKEYESYGHHSVDYEAFDNGHGRFYAGRVSNFQGNVKRFGSDKDPVDAMADRLQLLVDGMDAQVLQDDVDLLRTLRGKVPEGSNLGAEYVRVLYEDATQKGRPMPAPKPEILSQWGGMIFLFPNVLIFPQAGNAMIYRALPDPENPHVGTFEIFSTRSLPKDAVPERAVCEVVTEPNSPDQVYLIPRQDLGNLERIQKGLRSKSIKQIWLASHNEKIILNMHQELDKFVQAE